MESATEISGLEARGKDKAVWKNGLKRKGVVRKAGSLLKLSGTDEKSHESVSIAIHSNKRSHQPANRPLTNLSSYNHFTMATESQPTPAAPELTLLTRVASIPLVNDSLSAVHATLTSNPLTRSPYNTAQALSSTALRYSEPITSKLAPIIVRADGYANKGLDVVESRYPYPFTVQSQDVINALKERSDYARGVANKTIDERVRNPAYSAAQGIDQVRTLLCPPFERNSSILPQKRLSPVVDYLVSRLGTQEGASETESKYQYQRAYALSRDLKDQILDYSNTQLHQLQSSSILVFVYALRTMPSFLTSHEL